MPVSRRRRRKNGKLAKHDPHKAGRPSGDPGARESGVSLQDLINVLAYQEYVKDGTIAADSVRPELKIDEEHN